MIPSRFYRARSAAGARKNWYFRLWENDFKTWCDAWHHAHFPSFKPLCDAWREDLVVIVQYWRVIIYHNVWKDFISTWQRTFSSSDITSKGSRRRWRRVLVYRFRQCDLRLVEMDSQQGTVSQIQSVNVMTSSPSVGYCVVSGTSNSPIWVTNSESGNRSHTLLFHSPNPATDGFGYCFPRLSHLSSKFILLISPSLFNEFAPFNL